MPNYKLATQRLEDGVIRLDDNAYIPADPGNRDWRAFLAWNATPLPPDPPRSKSTYPTVEEQLEALYLARKGDTAKLAEIDSRISSERIRR